MTISEERLEMIEKSQNTILETVTELKMAICGSEKIGVEGLIMKVRRHENYIESDKKQKWTLAGAASVVASGLAYLFSRFF